MQENDTCNDVINKYLQKHCDQRRKLLILRSEGMENYNSFKKSYTNGKIALL